VVLVVQDFAFADEPLDGVGTQDARRFRGNRVGREHPKIEVDRAEEVFLETHEQRADAVV